MHDEKRQLPPRPNELPRPDTKASSSPDRPASSPTRPSTPLSTQGLIVPETERTASTGSIPPPPPSTRPVSARPPAPVTTPLPPPLGLRPSLPQAPPAVRVTPTISVEQKRLASEVKRLEADNQNLRDRLTTQREETRVAQKNIELLRAEVAQLKIKSSGISQASTFSHAQVEKIRSDHLVEMRAAREKHLREIADLRRAHLEELRVLKAEARGDRSSLPPDQKPAFGIAGRLQELERQVADLSAKNTHYRQKNTELREANGTLEDRVRTLQAAKLGAPRVESIAPANVAEAEVAPAIATPAHQESNPPVSMTPVDEQPPDAAETTADPLTEAASTPAFPPTPQVAQVAAPAPSTQKDDLTELKGVGPAIARALQSAGITQFAQIAAWTESDIEAIAPRVKATAARIKKNRWVETAKSRLKRGLEQIPSPKK